MVSFVIDADLQFWICDILNILSVGKHFHSNDNLESHIVYRGRFKMSDVVKNSDGTFTNTRTGEIFSAERAHQNVGESIRGIEKAKSKTTGNYYMREELEDTMATTLAAGILGSHGRSA
jgi:hypothetical protein